MLDGTWLVPALTLCLMLFGWWLAGDLVLSWGRLPRRDVWLEASR